MKLFEIEIALYRKLHRNQQLIVHSRIDARIHLNDVASVEKWAKQIMNLNNADISSNFRSIITRS